MTQSTEFGEERRLTKTIVERMVPRVIESLALACNHGDTQLLADEARRLVLNLLVFIAAAVNGEIRASLIRDGTRLLERIVAKPDNVEKRPLVKQLQEFLTRRAGTSWRKLAPRLLCDFRQLFDCPSNGRSDERLQAALRPLFSFAQDCDVDHAVPRVLERGIPGFSVRQLGAVHEALLARRLVLRRGRAELVVDKTRRRHSGSFYTPEPLVRLLVEETVGAVLRKQLRTIAELPKHSRASPIAEQRGFTIVDPAMGSGHFLAAALDHSVQLILKSASRRSLNAEILARCLCGLPKTPRALAGATERNDMSAVKRELIAHAIHGFDTDADSVELARLSLWLDSGQPIGKVLALAKNLSVRDPLLSPPELRGKVRRFDVVIGNPPYGAPADLAYRSLVRRALPLTRSNSDLAVAFVERAISLIKPGGRVGLVLPKPLTYSYAWRQVRQALRGRVDWVCDVGRGWDDVLLEQVLVALSSEERPGNTYRASRIDNRQALALPGVPRAWSDQFDVLLSGLSRENFDRLCRMQFADATVGDLCRTFRGVPWQRRLLSADNPASGAVPLFGGRDLERWNVRSSSGSVSIADVDRDLSPFRQEKLLFQNIIAHIERPSPRIRLIGTLDSDFRNTLDTVNNLVPRNTSVDLKAVLALLHSEPVNWLVYNVVYNRAIRTMHFDQYFINKIPLPPGWDSLSIKLSELASRCLHVKVAKLRAKAERQIDDLVAVAYEFGK